LIYLQVPLRTSSWRFKFFVFKVLFHLFNCREGLAGQPSSLNKGLYKSYFLYYFSAVADTSFYPKNPLVIESNYPFFHTNLQGESITWKRKLAIGVFKSGKLDIDEIITWKPGN
jgi:hypothetical protein